MVSKIDGGGDDDEHENLGLCQMMCRLRLTAHTIKRKPQANSARPTLQRLASEIHALQDGSTAEPSSTAFVPKAWAFHRTAPSSSPFFGFFHLFHPLPSSDSTSHPSFAIHHQVLY